MKTYRAVEDAADLVTFILRSNSLPIDTDLIKNAIYKWYTASDVTNPEILAAAALETNFVYSPHSYDWMLQVKKEWFPQSA